MNRGEELFKAAVQEPIEVSAVVKKKVLESFSQIRNEKKSRVNVRFVKIASAVSLIALILVGSFSSAVYAGFKAISYNISTALGISGELKPYTTVINQSVLDDNVTITLNEVILSGNELIVSTTETYAEKLAENGYSEYSAEVYVNGRRVSYAASGGSTQIDDYNIESVMTYLLEDIGFAQDLDMELIFSDGNGINFVNNSDLKFAFNTSGAELAVDTTDIEIDQTFTFEDGHQITAYRYTRSPLLDKIMIKRDEGFNYDLILKGEDNLGNPVSFSLSSSNDENMILKEDAVSGNNVSTEAKSLTLTLYAVKFPEQSGKLSNDFQQVGESFTIDIE